MKKPMKSTTTAAVKSTTSHQVKPVVAKLGTKGQSKITADQVIAARKLKVAEPDLSMQAIKDRLKLRLSVIMVGRVIRGISHAHLDILRSARPSDGRP